MDSFNKYSEVVVRTMFHQLGSREQIYRSYYSVLDAADDVLHQLSTVLDPTELVERYGSDVVGLHMQPSDNGDEELVYAHIQAGATPDQVARILNYDHKLTTLSVDGVVIGQHDCKNKAVKS